MISTCTIKCIHIRRVWVCRCHCTRSKWPVCSVRINRFVSCFKNINTASNYQWNAKEMPLSHFKSMYSDSKCACYVSWLACVDVKTSLAALSVCVHTRKRLFLAAVTNVVALVALVVVSTIWLIRVTISLTVPKLVLHFGTVWVIRLVCGFARLRFHIFNNRE